MVGKEMLGFKGEKRESDVTAFAAQEELLIHSVKFQRMCVCFSAPK